MFEIAYQADQDGLTFVETTDYPLRLYREFEIGDPICNLTMAELLTIATHLSAAIHKHWHNKAYVLQLQGEMVKATRLLKSKAEMDREVSSCYLFQGLTDW